MKRLINPSQVPPGDRWRGWVRTGRFLIKSKTFTDFRQAMAWVGRVARLAEKLGHHPDIEIRWNRVRLRLTTHDAGGLTQKDWDWAENEVAQLGGPKARELKKTRTRVQSF